MTARVGAGHRNEGLGSTLSPLFPSGPIPAPSTSKFDSSAPPAASMCSRQLPVGVAFHVCVLLATLVLIWFSFLFSAEEAVFWEQFVSQRVDAAGFLKLPEGWLNLPDKIFVRDSYKELFDRVQSGSCHILSELMGSSTTCCWWPSLWSLSHTDLPTVLYVLC